MFDYLPSTSNSPSRKLSLAGIQMVVVDLLTDVTMPCLVEIGGDEARLKDGKAAGYYFTVSAMSC